MASYAMRPDGLADVELDDGTVMPMSLSPDLLEANGIAPRPAPPPLSASPAATAQAVPAMAQPGPHEALQGVGFLAQPQQPQAMSDGSRLLSDEQAARLSQRQPVGGLVSMPAEGAPGPDIGQPQPRPMSESQAAADAYLQAAMRPVYVPGRAAQDVRTGYSVQKAAPLSEDRQAAQVAAMDQQTQAAEMAVARQAQTADAELAATDAAIAARKDHIRREQALQQQRAAKLDELRAQRDAKRREIPDINPDRIWEKNGGIGRLFAAISVAVGGYAQGMNGGENPGLSIIRAGIQDDIMAQKEAAQSKRDAADLADNDYQQLLAAYGDPSLAETELGIRQLEMVEHQAKRQVQQAQSEERKAAGMQLLADLQAEKEAKITEWEGKAGTMVEQFQHDPGRAGGYARKDPVKAAEEAARLKGALDKISGVQDVTPEERRYMGERQVRMPDGSKAWAKDSQTATNTQEMFKAHAIFKGQMSRLFEIMDKEAFKTGSPSLHGEAEAIVAANKLSLRRLEELGAITEADQDLVGPLTGAGVADVGSWDDSTIAKMRTSVKYVDDKMHEQTRTLYRDPYLDSPIFGGTGSASRDLGATSAPWSR